MKMYLYDNSTMIQREKRPLLHVAAAIFLTLLLVPLTAFSQISVPWEYQTHTAIALGGYDDGTGNSDSAVEFSFSPASPLPINAEAFTHDDFFTQSGRGTSSIGIGPGGYDYSMSVSSLAAQYNPFPDGSASGKGAAVFSGSFTATLPLYQFYYDFDYSLFAESFTDSYSADNSIKAKLSLYDATAHSTILDEIFIVDDVTAVNNTAQSNNSGTGMLYTPVTVGNDIAVLLSLYDESAAQAHSRAGTNSFDLSYKMVLVPEPLSSSLFIIGGAALGWRRLRNMKRTS